MGPSESKHEGHRAFLLEKVLSRHQQPLCTKSFLLPSLQGFTLVSGVCKVRAAQTAHTAAPEQQAAEQSSPSHCRFQPCAPEFCPHSSCNVWGSGQQYPKSTSPVPRSERIYALDGKKKALRQQCSANFANRCWMGGLTFPLLAHTLCAL